MTMNFREFCIASQPDEDDGAVGGRHFQKDLLTRIGARGFGVDCLDRLLIFCEERYPQWYSWEGRLWTLAREYGEEHECTVQNGQQYCRGLWAGWLYHTENEA